MSASENFDEIRPYRDAEVPEVMNRLLSDPVFDRVIRSLYADEAKVMQIREAFRQTTDVRSFQIRFSVPYLENILETSSDGLTVGGLEFLDKNESYLFISNHRDIILDSALLNVEIYRAGFNPTEIAIGSNLLVYPWIEDVSRVNRSFIVKRNIPVREMLASSQKLSGYIRETLTNKGNSIWIAQREGRSKDGFDQTSQALLKMLNMSNKGDFVEGFKELQIVPMSISYEIEPCGNEKVAELLKRQADSDFQKGEKDDLMSMLSGLKNPKGRIQIQFAPPLDQAMLEGLSDEGNINDRLKRLADLIDYHIYRNYKLYPNNYIAYDIVYNCTKYQDQYTQVQRDAFLDFTHKRLALVGEDRQEATELWLKMYATPVLNFEGTLQS